MVFGSLLFRTKTSRLPVNPSPLSISRPLLLTAVIVPPVAKYFYVPLTTVKQLVCSNSMSSSRKSRRNSQSFDLAQFYGHIDG